MFYLKHNSFVKNGREPQNGIWSGFERERAKAEVLLFGLMKSRKQNMELQIKASDQDSGFADGRGELSGTSPVNEQIEPTVAKLLRRNSESVKQIQDKSLP